MDINIYPYIVLKGDSPAPPSLLSVSKMATGGSAGNTALQQLSKIRNELTCSICQNLFDTPKILPCLHNFCAECLQKNMQKRPKEKPGGDARDELICPLCNDPKTPIRLPAEGVSALKTNFTFENLINHLRLEDTVTGGGGGKESAPSSGKESTTAPENASMCLMCAQDPAISFCTICNLSLCSHCEDSHRRVLDTKTHQIVPLGSELMASSHDGHLPAEKSKRKGSKSSPSEFSGIKHNPWKCDKHKTENVKMYCKPPCDEVICVHCAITKPHKPHDFYFAEEIIDEYREKLVRLTTETEQIEQEFGKAMDTIKKTITRLEESGEAKEKDVREQNELLKKELDRQEAVLIQQVRGITEKKKRCLNEQFDELKRMRATLQEGGKFATDIKENCIPVEFLFLWSQIELRLRELNKRYRTHPREPRDNDIVQFAKNQELQKMITESNAIGRVFADAHAEAFTADELDKAHFIRGRSVVFKVTPRDVIGSRLYENYNPIQVELQPDGQGEAVQCQVTNNEDGTHNVTVQPRTQGPHTLTLSLKANERDIPIMKRPFHINVAPPHCKVTEAAQVISTEATGNKMKNPWGITVTKQGWIVVSDVQSNHLIIFNQDRKFRCTIGTEGKGKLEFASPRGLAVTLDNHIIVTEKGNHRLQEISFDGDGQFVQFFGTNKPGEPGGKPGQFHSPTAVAINSQGIVFATDTINQRVQYFQPDGRHLGIIGQWGSHPNAFDHPYAICIYNQPHISGEGSYEKVFITERHGHRVKCFQKKDEKYECVSIFGEKGTDAGQLEQPVGLTVDPKSGYVFVVELSNHRLSLFSRSGEFLYSFGSKDDKLMPFYNPLSVAVLNNSHIVMTDTGNGRIVVVRILED